MQFDKNRQLLDGSTKLISDVQQRYLETCIPRKGKSVMVVRHSDVSLEGQLAKLIEANDKREEAFVQFDESFDHEVIIL